jgi:ABC-2 type transport system ATP-binding protein
MSQPAVSVESLGKAYGSVRALDGVDLMVREGEVFGLVGPNGAGKSTTLRTITTLLDVEEGSVSVFGTDVDERPARARERLSYLPEEAGAYDTLTGRQFLRFTADMHGGDADAMVEHGVDVADLGERIDDKVDGYSKGMTRRLLVARTLMTDPQLVVLDEPTAGLDVINSREVREVILDVPGDGRSVLLSSHDMLEVQTLCDRVALLNEGEVVARGPPEELVADFGVEDLEAAFVEAVS